MKIIKTGIFIILFALAVDSVVAASSGYTYRVMERKRKAKEKTWQRQQIKSPQYQKWQKGFIKRMRCLGVDPKTANDNLRASCFNLPPKATKPTAGNQQQK